MSTKKGTQTVAMTMAKGVNLWWRSSTGMFVMPKTDVTNVRGRKKMLTNVSNLMFRFCSIVVKAAAWAKNSASVLPQDYFFQCMRLTTDLRLSWIEVPVNKSSLRPLISFLRSLFSTINLLNL